MTSHRYTKSEETLERALQTIPLGSQTFSKSFTHYPHGVSPYFITRGRGATVWDIDGNSYTDFINALYAVTLGYCDPDVDNAVRQQLENGVTFTLAHPLEYEVAERIVEMVPCAEMVRFGKNGSDATAGAIRIARAYTGRDRVAVCGYHGWQDWYIGSTARSRGVPQATRDLTHSFPYNDIGALEELLNQYEGEFAAVILEPMNSNYPKAGYLEAVREITRRRGIVLIFDEMITGFRLANGGAQQLFGVTPDLTTLGKGIANGFAVSAVVGQRDLMKLMEEVFFSFTFGGETLSLAAAKATLDKLQGEPILAGIASKGQFLQDEINKVLSKVDKNGIFSISGHPSWTFLNIKERADYNQYQIRTVLQQELQARGFLTVGTHAISHAHTLDDINSIVAAYEEIMSKINAGIGTGTFDGLLHCAPLQPLFKVR